MLFGALFSLFAKRERGDLLVFSSPWFWHGVVFSSLFNAAVLYAALKFPDWMWMYFLEDSRTGPVTLVYLFLFLYYFPYVLGFYLGRIFILKGKLPWLCFVLFLLGWEGWLIGRLFDRYSVVGTREEFFNGTAVSLFSPQNPVGLAMNLAVCAMVIYYLLVWWTFRKKRRRYMDAEL